MLKIPKVPRVGGFLAIKDKFSYLTILFLKDSLLSY